MQLICDGQATKREVLDQTIEQYKEVYVKARREMETLKAVGYSGFPWEFHGGLLSGFSLSSFSPWTTDLEFSLFFSVTSLVVLFSSVFLVPALLLSFVFFLFGWDCVYNTGCTQISGCRASTSTGWWWWR